MTNLTGASPHTESNSDRRLLIGIFVAVATIAIIAVLATPVDNGPPLSTHSSAVDGAMALRLWLEKLGHPTTDLTSKPIVPGAEKTLFILDPDIGYSATEALTLQKWVRAGHTLILAGNISVINTLLKPYSVSLQYFFPDSDIAPAAAPVLIKPPTDKAEIQPDSRIETSRDDVATFLTSEGYPVLVSFPEQAGRVWVMSGVYPFTNIGLQNKATAKLVLNLLTSLDAGAVAFDEGAHGYSTDTADSVSSWLFTTPPGLSILLALVLTLVFLALRGRRFGRAVTLPQERLRREPVEYIQAIPSLFPPSVHPGDILQHYGAQLPPR